MAPDSTKVLLSPNPKQRREQERAQVVAASRVLVAEARALREKAAELQRMADELMVTLRREREQS